MEAKKGLFIFIEAILLITFSSYALAADVAYILANDRAAKQEILDIFSQLNLSVQLIEDNDVLSYNLSNYKLIFVDDARVRKTGAIEIYNYPAIIMNQYYGVEWGLTDSDGISQLGANSPLSVKANNSILQVYTKAKSNGASIPYYYLSDGNKAPGITGAARTYTGENTYNFGDVVAFAPAGTSLVNGKVTGNKLCFYGIAKTKYWTGNATNLFLDCVAYVVPGDIDKDNHTDDTDCDSNIIDDPSPCPTNPETYNPNIIDCSDSAYSQCAYCINSDANEVCDGVDNDCDGSIDEGFGQDDCEQKCSYTWTGNGGSLNCCGDDANEDAPYETTETSCDDGNDNDCDGYIDIEEDSDCAECVNGEAQLCQKQDGVCEFSFEICAGNRWPGCNYSAIADYESDEISCDGLDNDCDGSVDEGFGQDDCEQKCSYTWTGNGGSLNCCGDDGNENSPYQAAESYCSDGNDNDCDNLVDMSDPDCLLYECSNGADDDSDLLVDWSDPGCYTNGFYNPQDDNEGDDPACYDGTDNDADSLIDYPADSGCDSVFDDDEREKCQDTIDNDFDSLADANDPGCYDSGAYDPTDNNETDSLPACSDYFDNDGDGAGLIDENDPGCHSDNDANNSGSYNSSDGDEKDAPYCSNGILEAGEECDDSNLIKGDGCSDSCETTTQCFDGITNDADNYVDNLDLGCYIGLFFDPALDDETGDCADNDGDGYNITGSYCGEIDCNDTSSAQYPGAPELCNNKDDDCDGLIDESLSQSCGSGNCAGAQTCTAGAWSDCSTRNQDCGTCCICENDNNPAETYDAAQNADCTAYDCDPLDTACTNYNDVQYCKGINDCADANADCNDTSYMPTTAVCNNNYLCSGSPGGDNLYNAFNYIIPSQGYCDGSGSCDYSSSAPSCSLAEGVATEGTGQTICIDNQSSCANSCTDTIDNDADGCADSIDSNCGGTDTACNGIDDDCDGSIDEDYASTACGSGACNGTSSCISGAVSCSTQSADCGTCCICENDNNPAETYDAAQNADCTAYDCDPLDTACTNYNDAQYCKGINDCADANADCNDTSYMPTTAVCNNNYLCSGSPGGDNLYNAFNYIIPSQGYCDGSGSCDYSLPAPICNLAEGAATEGSGQTICADAQSSCINSCTDTLDNDVDGCADSIDSNCGGSENPTATCKDGIDNDCDGLTDCADTNCFAAGWVYDSGWIDPVTKVSQSQYGLCNNGAGGYCGAHQKGWVSCSDRSTNVYWPGMFWCNPNDCGADIYREFMIKLDGVTGANDCLVTIRAKYDDPDERIRFTTSYDGNSAVRTVDVPDPGTGEIEVTFPGTYPFQTGTNYLHFKHPTFCTWDGVGSVHVRRVRVQCGFIC